jgi:cytochrome c-type biogenesis protein CcmH
VRRVLALLSALALAAPGAVSAADCPKATLRDVEDEVMCPVCGTPLALATEAPQAQRERELIQRLIARCKSKREIKDALVVQFGDQVLATPDDEGFDLAAYLVPAGAVLLGAGAVGFAAVRWRRRRTTAGASTEAPGAAADRRLDSDLERYDL